MKRAISLSLPLLLLALGCSDSGSGAQDPQGGGQGEPGGNDASCTVREIDGVGIEVSCDGAVVDTLRDVPQVPQDGQGSDIAQYTARVIDSSRVEVYFNGISIDTLAWNRGLNGGNNSPFNSAIALSSGTETTSSSAADAGNVALSEILSEAEFKRIFPIMDPSNSAYSQIRSACTQTRCRDITTYQGLLAAAAKVPDFLSKGSLDDRKRELAAFFANVYQETGGGWESAPGGYEAWGLCFCAEQGFSDASVGGYSTSSDPNYQAAAGKSYHGRGAIQLSYPYNYGPASEYLYGDKRWLSNPELVLQSAEGFWGSGLWFWMVKEDVAPGETPPQGQPGAKGFDGKYYKPSCHMAMAGDWTPRTSDVEKKRTEGFGVTINVVNGGLECGGSWGTAGQNRVRMYKHFAQILGVEPVPSGWTGSDDDYLTCKNQTSFSVP